MLVTYFTSKAFLTTFTTALTDELKSNSILVHHLNTFYIISKMSKLCKPSLLVASLQPMFLPSWGILVNSMEQCSPIDQAYERAKHGRNCPGKGDGSEVKWEMNELKDWSKGILQILETGANCLRQHWMGIVGCDWGIESTMAWPDGVGCVDMAVFTHGTWMTSLAGLGQFCAGGKPFWKCKQRESECLGWGWPVSPLFRL